MNKRQSAAQQRHEQQIAADRDTHVRSMLLSSGILVTAGDINIVARVEQDGALRVRGFAPSGTPLTVITVADPQLYVPGLYERVERVVRHEQASYSPATSHNPA
jgi:hypothetical protein